MRRQRHDDIEIEIVDRPRRDILILKILFDNGPTSLKEIHRILHEKYGDTAHYKAVHAMLMSLMKFKMVKRSGRVGNEVLYAITERGLKLLRYEGLLGESNALDEGGGDKTKEQGHNNN